MSICCNQCYSDDIELDDIFHQFKTFPYEQVTAGCVCIGGFLQVVV